jgi:hypothetical protein
MAVLRRALPFATAALVLALAGAGCGSGAGSASKPVDQVPEANGLRDKVRVAESPRAADFPATKGRTLQQVADRIGGGDVEAALASSVFDVGGNRLAFGVIDGQGRFVYGKTAVYVSRGPGQPAQGPYLAPADVLLTKPPYRSKQAATEQDPFSAIYAAQVPFRQPGRWTVLVATRRGGRLVAAPTQVHVNMPADDPIPRVGQRPPRVVTDTVASAKGDVSKIDTRQPPDDMHDVSFAAALGKKPVALLFATPQLCQSRVCGPVTDLEEQMKATYGKQMAFIHQEVYVDNNVRKGLREPLRRFQALKTAL